ncbi:beta-1,4-galactosyltransferase 6-like [Amphiura filiformis]|uniref:beta-1,4-galactosyltransferase 6-like n=1 Tax=Amphiura filiformis TaxID=82378 RepID=UPI003B21B5CF
MFNLSYHQFCSSEAGLVLTKKATERIFQVSWNMTLIPFPDIFIGTIAQYYNWTVLDRVGFMGDIELKSDVCTLSHVITFRPRVIGKNNTINAICATHPKDMVKKTEWFNATSACPEFDIPGLIRERKLNLSEVSLDKVEQILFGDRLKDAKRLAEKTTHLINNNRVSSNKTFVPCNYLTSSDQCGNKYYKKVLESSGMVINNYVYTPGGIWTPKECFPRWKVAIVFPYRDRAFHLPIIIRELTTMLQHQKLEFGFYVAEQANDLNFNRAMLMNVGFLEALNFSKWDCFIFHDVDHVPLSDYNYYGCSGMPRHFLSGADRWNYTILYSTLFGGMTGLTRSQVFQINGFPNVYWGWGGEDDEIRKRVKEAKLDITRAKGPTGYYNCIKHHHHSAPHMPERVHLLKHFKKRLHIDGLNNLQYRKPTITLSVLYTNISVDIQKLKVDVRP